MGLFRWHFRGVLRAAFRCDEDTSGLRKFDWYFQFDDPFGSIARNVVWVYRLDTEESSVNISFVKFSTVGLRVTHLYYLPFFLA